MSENIKTEPSDLAAGEDMHIHKPKAAHSLREFASEIGVIVVGVLIALAMEQAVEWMRLQSEIAETRETLLAEISRNATRATVAAIEDKCLLVLDQNWAGWTKGKAKPDLKTNPYMFDMQSTAWDLAKTGVVGHMPMGERMSLAGYYYRLKLYNENEARIREIGTEIGSIELLEKLNDSDAQTLLKETNGANILLVAQLGNATDLIEAARDLGVNPKPMSADTRGHLEKLCREAGAPQ